MNAKGLIVIGAALALAIGLLGVQWVPYGDTGTPDASEKHFLALSVTLLDVLAVFFYAALRSSAASRQTSFSGITAGYFLGMNALLTLTLLVRTYFGMSYPLFWSLQGVQWALVLALLFAGDHVGQLAASREENAKIASLRKESLIADIDNMCRRFPAGDDTARKLLLSLARKLVEELRFYPNQEIPVAAGNPFGRVAQWRIAVEAFLGSPSDKGTTTVAPPELVAEAGAIASALAGYKR
jgi:hypothetical protein